MIVQKSLKGKFDFFVVAKTKAGVEGRRPVSVNIKEPVVIKVNLSPKFEGVLGPFVEVSLVLGENG